MELALQPDEVSLLHRILSNYLSDLRMEISNTEDYEMRQAMKGEEEAIKKMIAELEELPKI